MVVSRIGFIAENCPGSRRLDCKSQIDPMLGSRGAYGSVIAVVASAGYYTWRVEERKQKQTEVASRRPVVGSIDDLTSGANSPSLSIFDGEVVTSPRSLALLASELNRTSSRLTRC